MTRKELLQQLKDPSHIWDLIVIGGGATGLGTAVEAASRGYRTLLLEQSDFAKATSSRSTKLIHGGVRYLKQGNLSLVLEALHERGHLLKNAPHLVHNLSFVVPLYDWWEGPFYGIGLKFYDMMAGRLGLGPSRLLSREETLERLPTMEPKGLRGGRDLSRRSIRRCPAGGLPGPHHGRSRRDADQLYAGDRPLKIRRPDGGSNGPRPGRRP